MAPITTRLRRLFGELSYAQRRSFELRTGVPLSASSPRNQREIDQLDALWSRYSH